MGGLDGKVALITGGARGIAGEPIRTLDAIHLASALTARAAVAGLALLTLDDRIRRAGAQLGFSIRPE